MQQPILPVGPLPLLACDGESDDASHLLGRACSSTGGLPVMRQELRRMMQFSQPLGIYFLAQAKMLWLDSMPGVMPFLPNHDCFANGGSGCRRIKVTMRVFVQDPATEDSIRSAHLCLYDHAMRRHLCPNEHAVHEKRLATIDHDELYFCNLTGRVHVCGPGVCMLAHRDMRREDEYQAVCPITGLVATDELNVVVGSEFWKAGQDVGSSSDQRSDVRHQQYSHSADDLNRLIRLYEPRTDQEALQLLQQKQQQSTPASTKRSTNSGKGRELARYIAARNETTFTHRKKLDSPLWLEWAQKFADWDPWLDVLLAMDTFQKIATHLKDITQENYRKVWRLDGLVRRYATALVYAAFCRERHASERRMMSDELSHSVKRIAETKHQQQEMVFSQLADATFGAVTRGRHGSAFTLSAELALSNESTNPQDPELRLMITRYAQRVLHLWVIVNEACQGEGLLAPTIKTSLDAFPLAHFVYPALGLLADGLCLAPAVPGGQPEYAIPRDPDMRRSLPKSWDCLGSSLYDHTYGKTVHANCVYAITSAIQSGRMPRDYMAVYQRQWEDVQLEKAPWIAPLPNKHIFRHSPKKLALAGPPAPRPIC